jgi:polysaccharide pyruvyl transferase WcaK-like protein
LRSWLKLNFIRSNAGIKWCDFVVFGGGGLLNSEVPRSISIWGKVINKAVNENKGVYMLGQSFSNASSPRILNLISKVNLVTVRDSLSYQALSRLNCSTPVRLTSDLVFDLSAEQISSGKTKFDDQFIVLNLRKYINTDQDAVFNTVNKIISYISKNTPYSIYLVPFGPGDTEVLSKLQAEHTDNGRVVLLPHDKQECLDAIRSSKAVISMRLHPSIIGLVNSKPVLGLSYSSKVLGLLKDNEVPCLDLNEEYEGDVNILLDDLLSIKYDLDLDNLSLKATDNFKFLQIMVEGK